MKSNMKEPFEENIEINDDYFEEEIKKPKFLKKKILFFILGIFFLLIILLFGFLLLNLKSSSEEEQKDNDAVIMISEINCTFFIYNNSFEYKILNNEFLNNTKIKVKIDGISFNSSNLIQFEKNETNEVQIIIEDEINMDYLFKDILILKEVRMNSNSSSIISSMESVFEGCENLEIISIKGF